MKSCNFTSERSWAVGRRVAVAASLSAGIAMLVGPSVVQAGPIADITTADLYDTFTVDDGTGTAGGALQGTAVESGNGTWQEDGLNATRLSEADYEYTASGQVVIDFSEETGVTESNWPLSVGIPGGDVGTTAGNQIATIQADLNPESTGTDGYLMLALSRTNNVFADGVQVRLLSNGNWAVHSRTDHGGTEEIGSGNVSGTGFHTVTLEYNALDHLVSTWIDSALVVDHIDLDDPAFSALLPDDLDEIGTASMRTQNVQESGTDFFDNFAVNVSEVPEPGTLALLALGGLAMLSRRRKHDEQQC